MRWQPVDTRDDPHEPRFTGDPAELVDAYADMLALLDRPAWHAHAACRGQGTGAWFPARGQDPRPAQAICAGCPVAEQCLRFGHREKFGIWGGTSEKGRRQLRRSTDVESDAA